MIEEKEDVDVELMLYGKTKNIMYQGNVLGHGHDNAEG